LRRFFPEEGEEAVTSTWKKLLTSVTLYNNVACDRPLADLEEVLHLKHLVLSTILLYFGLAFDTASYAHFAMLIPSRDVVGADDNRNIGIVVQFTHPFKGGPLMHMERPEKFGVIAGEQVSDLLSTLKENNVNGVSSWEASYLIKKPADYLFFLEPKPYWEPAEDKFIVHVTKVIVDALGAEEGWDRPIAKVAGLSAEIVPLTRPYGLYAGNLFTGQVYRDGRPAPGVQVEVELWGDGKMKAPTDAHVTQVVKADDNGMFSYAMPKAGWWGFSAIMEGPAKIRHDGEEKNVELGAVIWVRVYPME